LRSVSEYPMWLYAYLDRQVDNEMIRNSNLCIQARDRSKKMKLLLSIQKSIIASIYGLLTMVTCASSYAADICEQVDINHTNLVGAYINGKGCSEHMYWVYMSNKTNNPIAPFKIVIRRNRDPNEIYYPDGVIEFKQGLQPNAFYEGNYTTIYLPPYNPNHPTYSNQNEVCYSFQTTIPGHGHCKYEPSHKYEVCKTIEKSDTMDCAQPKPMAMIVPDENGVGSLPRMVPLSEIRLYKPEE